MGQETLTIPEEEVVPLGDITQTIHGLRLLFVNVFGVGNPGGTWTLIDAGLPHSAGKIKAWAKQTWGVPPNAILLTHGHFDHVSAAKELAEEWEVPIYAHARELPFLTGRESYPPPDPLAGGGVMALLSPLYPRAPVDLGSRVHALDDVALPEGNLPFMPGWYWIPTPGHTVGHVSLFHVETRALIVGDAFCTVQSESLMAIARMKPELHGPPSYYTPDWGAAKASVERLAALAPETLIPGHGQPISGPDVPGQLARLAARFYELAVPGI